MATNGNGEKVKSMESWIWDAACSIRGAADAAKFKDYILPLIFIKRLCDVFDDEIDRIAEKVKSRTKALQLVERDKSIVRFYIPIKPKDPEKERTWDVVRKLSDKIGQQLTDILRDVAKENKDLQGIIDRVDFNATTHGQRDIDDDRLSKLIEKVSEKRLGLKDVEPDIIGRSYEYLIRKFAEGSGQRAGEFDTPKEEFINNPNWKTSEKELRDLRKGAYFALLGEEDDIDKAAAIVEDLFTQLFKAYNL